MIKQKGYSQIEVLVSVLVLAIGILGMGGLQATSLQNSQRSVLRTQAAYLSYEILDRMRANKAEAKNGAYNTALGAAVNAQNCLDNECTTAQMATFDLQEWKCSVGVQAACAALAAGGLADNDNKVGLPNGDGSVVYDAAADEFTIEIRWNEARKAAGNETYQTYTIVTAL